MVAEQKTYRTITLTGRPPVRIRQADWPLIARAGNARWDGQYRFQATRITDVAIRVRRHADGRMVVYGIYDYETKWQGERDVRIRAGYLLPAGDDPVAAIQAVGADINERLGGEDEELVRGAVDRCVAALPAEEIA